MRRLRVPAALCAALALAGCGSAAGDVAIAEETEADALYATGLTFSEFLEAAEERRDTWHDNYAAASVAPEVLARARAAGEGWRMLVVAEDWCGDSANTIPYVARLVEQVDGLDMRIVNSDVGRAIMEAHPTPDGRPATPTVVLLDPDGHDAGCFVERPPELQTWFLEQEELLDEDTLYDRKYAWYDGDAGASTVEEVVQVLESAGNGTVRGCSP